MSISRILTFKGKDLLAIMEIGPNDHHGQSHVCPICKADLNRVGINRLVYTHEICQCDKADWNHLVEQLWHKSCFSTNKDDYLITYDSEGRIG